MAKTVAKTVVITDTQYRFTVPAIRVLARSGYRVVAAAWRSTPRREVLGFLSRYADAREWLDDDDLPGSLARLRRQYGDFALLPVSIRTMALLNEQAAARREFHVCLPSAFTLEQCNDTAKLLSLVAQQAVPAPYTYARGEAVADFPCIIKYRSGELLHLKPKERYAIVRDAAEFAAVYAAFDARQSDPVVQQYVDGSGYGVGFVANARHEIVDFICHQRLREYPISGGPSAYCVSIFDPELLRMTRILARETRYCGIGMAEFKGSPERGFYLMEINPRFWGSSPLIETARSSVYASLARLNAGEDLAEDLSVRYETGRRMRFFPQNMLALRDIGRRDGGGVMLRLWLKEYLRPGTKEGIWRLSDPRPFWRYVRNLAGRGHQAGPL